ncbi:MAG: NADH-quinone oxidoreductase subunit N [Verrucomicrobia bacterium]|nr:NADH-quinone oxidoreductase subunit N [Verrucomicrobiota bacterium]
MNWEFHQNVADSNQWSAILPEIGLVVLALSLLLLDMFGGSKGRELVGKVSVFGQLVLLLLGFTVLRNNLGVINQETFAGMLFHSEFGQVMRIFFLVSSVLVSYLGSIFLRKNQLPGTEFYAILLLVTAGLMLLAQSNHFVMLFVALETVTVGFYVLVSYNRDRSNGLEAGLKYLIMGGFSTAILLMGIVLLFGIASSPDLKGMSLHAMKFSDLHVFLQLNSDNLVARTGVLLVIAGVAFKIGSVPFQIWIPDVYQGAPTPVTAALAVSSKAGGFAVLIALVSGPFKPMADLLVPVLSLMAIVTILFGNIAALTQRNVKRLMGLSGVSHAGYLLMGVVAMFSVPSAQNAVVFYLITYLLASFAVFGVMAHLSEKGKDDVQELSDYQDMLKESPFLSGVLVMGLGSLAGIPPLAGFIGKLLLFYAAFKAELYGLLGVAIVGVVISIYYYFGWIKEATFRFWKLPVLDGEEAEPPREWPEVTTLGKFTLGALALLTLLLGLYQGPLSSLIGD